LCICAAALAWLAAWPSLGQATTLSGRPFGYALAATGFPSYFIYDASPGQPVHGTLRLTSITPPPKTIVLSPADVTTASTGGLAYGNGAPSGEGRWLSLARSHVHLDSSVASASVPFTVRVPPNAGPGEHFLGIVAPDRRVPGGPTDGRGSIRLRLNPRLAMPVELRLPGP